MTSSDQLGSFESHQIAQTSIKVTNAGDGLSQALKIDPQVFHHGDIVHVVLECRVAKVTLEPLEPDREDLVRVHVLKAGSAAIAPPELVADLLAEQQERIRLAREIEGQQDMFDEGDE